MQLRILNSMMFLHPLTLLSASIAEILKKACFATDFLQQFSEYSSDRILSSISSNSISLTQNFWVQEIDQNMCLCKIIQLAEMEVENGNAKKKPLA